MHANIISSVGVWNNSTAANLATNQTSARIQPSRSAVRSPAITPNYSVSNNIVTYEAGGPTSIEVPTTMEVPISMEVPTSSSSNHNIQDQQELADYSLDFAYVPVSTPEYSPFDNLFSKVAQTSLWQQSVSTSMSGQTSMFQNNETQESLRHLPNLKPIGTERKTIMECMNRMSMMNLPPYNQ